jgi:hypothetical protein
LLDWALWGQGAGARGLRAALRAVLVRFTRLTSAKLMSQDCAIAEKKDVAA